MRILALTSSFPYPPDNGTKLRVSNLLRQLAAHHTIDLLAFSDQPVTPAQYAQAEQVCASVGVYPRRIFQPSTRQALAGLLSTRPRSEVATFSAEMAAAVAQHIARQPVDCVLAFEFLMAPYVPADPAIPAIVDELQVAPIYERYARQTQLAPRLRAGLTWLKTRAYVARRLARFAACTVASPRERDLVLKALHVAPERVIVVPNGADLSAPDTAIAPVADTLIYAGALTFDANFDAVDYFLRSIFPRIQTNHPDVVLTVTGSTQGVDLARLPAMRGLRLTGFVDDVRACVAASWASVVPLRVGGGTRLKILESLALGVPVVATSKGAEGLDLAPGEGILVADEPDAFARRTGDLLGDGELRQQIGARGRQAVQRYDWRKIGAQMNELVAQVCAKPATSSRAGQE